MVTLSGNYSGNSSNIDSESQEEKFDLWEVDLMCTPNVPQKKIYYLCADLDMAQAILNGIYGNYDEYSLNINKKYYPGIRQDHPSAIVIPDMPSVFRDIMLTVELQSPVLHWLLES
ncbi:hypothetical protein [Nostoc sp.]|uniref:hypothetical protein n=1 Tax=Nostoc sp. TaxID=1180 RepID=UPI002FFB4216